MSNELTTDQKSFIESYMKDVFVGGSWELVQVNDFLTVKISKIDSCWGEMVGYIQISTKGEGYNEVWNIAACDAMCEAGTMKFYNFEEQEYNFKCAEEAILAGRTDW
jgi:hypothetical protein